jgi:phosphohistidine phosphatase
MDLWLLRHAAAEARAPSGRDQDRELTEEGLERARAVARGLAVLEPGILRVVTSPYRRARQTAEPVAEALRLSAKLSESRALEPDRSPEEILTELEAEDCGSALLVGHEPHLGALLGRLVTGVGSAVEIPLKKAAVARVEWEGGVGTLRALLPARVLERLARAKG